MTIDERMITDREWGDYFWRIDSGEACPTCAQRIQALRVVGASGAPLWRCPHCRSEWRRYSDTTPANSAKV